MSSSQPDYLFNRAKNLFVEGTEALSKENLELAESKLLECLSILPDRESTKHNLAIVYTSKANAYADSGVFDEALAAYEKALDFNPRYVVALSNKGSILNEEFNLIEQAINCFREALKLEPDYSDAHQNLGVILAGQGK
jgi:tetratricopeptide (TPR) repeat protein